MGTAGRKPRSQARCAPADHAAATTERPGSWRRADAGHKHRSRARRGPRIRPQYPARRSPTDDAAGLQGSKRIGAGREPRSRARRGPRIRPQYPARRAPADDAADLPGSKRMCAAGREPRSRAEPLRVPPRRTVQDHVPNPHA